MAVDSIGSTRHLAHRRSFLEKEAKKPQNSPKIRGQDLPLRLTMGQATFVVASLVAYLIRA